MSIGQMQKHPIEKYILRIYKEGADLTIKEIVNPYCIHFCLALDTFDTNFVDGLAAELAKLLTQSDQHHPDNHKGNILFFKDKTEFLNELTLVAFHVATKFFPIAKDQEEIDKKYNILHRPGIEQYLTKLYSKQIITDSTFENETRKLYNKSDDTRHHFEKRALKRIYEKVMSQSVVQILELEQNFHFVIKESYDKNEPLAITTQVKDNLDFSSISILNDYTFRITPEITEYTIKQIIDLFAVVYFVFHEMVFNRPVITTSKTFAQFIFDLPEERKTWHTQNKCTIAYNTTGQLLTDLSNSFFGGVFKRRTRENYAFIDKHPDFIALIDWMESSPEALWHLSKQQGAGRKRSAIDQKLLTKDMSSKDRAGALTAIEIITIKLAEIEPKDLITIRNKVFNEAKRYFIERKKGSYLRFDRD